MTLFPDIPRREDSPVSAWLAVGEAFRHTGDSIRKALHEQAARKEAK
jgi:hypothetical protein